MKWMNGLKALALAASVALPALAFDAVPGITPAHAAGVEDNSPTASADVKQAQALIDAKDFPGALKMLTLIIAEKPKDADALNLMGYSLRKSGQWKNAEGFYLRALEVDAKHLGANEYLGELYAERGEIEKASERLKVLEAACGKDCEQTKDLAKAIADAPKKN